jgi:hypothetical protein
MTSGFQRLTRRKKFSCGSHCKSIKRTEWPARRRCGDKFETERFEPKINLRVHQTAGMNSQEFHLFDAFNLFNP